jgi:hypothetical protein
MYLYRRRHRRATAYTSIICIITIRYMYIYVYIRKIWILLNARTNTCIWIYNRYRRRHWRVSGRYVCICIYIHLQVERITPFLLTSPPSSSSAYMYVHVFICIYICIFLGESLGGLQEEQTEQHRYIQIYTSSFAYIEYHLSWQHLYGRHEQDDLGRFVIPSFAWINSLIYVYVNTYINM